MTYDPCAGKRAPLLAFLLATTSLWPLGANAQDTAPAVTLPVIDVATPLNTFYTQPTGQTETTIPRENILTNTKASSVLEVLRYSPGVSTKQGNGSRDVGISIRGSGARQGFGIRNIVVFEDDFPVTQPDGLSRTDLTDPQAYSGIDVIRGPSSAFYGNHAIGGAINFRLRKGSEINGLEVGNQGGSFGNLKNYFAYGSHGENWDSSIFFSNEIGNGPTNHNLFNTQTLNFLITYEPTPNDRFFVKGINNTLNNDLSFRLNLNQFYRNPFQTNCYNFGAANATIPAQANAALAAANSAGCATNQFSVNGLNNGTRVPLTAFESGARRQDRRSILGARWEHDLDANSVWRVQVVLDDKTINQPTGTTGGPSGTPAFNFISDITSKGTFLGLDAIHFVGGFANTETSSSYSRFIKPGGNANLGSLSTISENKQTNMGVRGREEIKLTDTLTAVAGLGFEYTKIVGTQLAYRYPVANNGSIIETTPTPANNSYYNIAPEGALLWRPNAEWQVRGRVGTGYGTPNSGQLFTDASGNPGNNTQLKSQTILGFDLGATYTPAPNIFLDVTGFYEFFTNEFVTQTVLGQRGPATFTFNAPKSEHRGVEVAGEWQFWPGWKFRAIYTYLNIIYTDYTETLASGGQVFPFNRAGNWMPGVVPNELTLRLGYDVPEGPLKGLGAFAEYFLGDAFYIDNANFLKVPGYRLVNLNIHYDTDVANSFIQKIGAFFEVRNVFDNTYIAGANNITNSINATGVQNNAAFLAQNATGTIYAGFPRAFYGGLKVRF